jgi:hypothetical protein
MAEAQEVEKKNSHNDYLSWKGGMSMRKNMAFTIALACVFAPGASRADMLTDNTWTQTWIDDFSAYDPPPVGETSFIGLLLGGSDNCSSDVWAEWQEPQYKGFKDDTNNVVMATPCTNAFDVGAAWTDFAGAALTDGYQRISFRVRSTATGGSDYSLNLIASSDEYNVEGSNAVPMWDVSNLALRPHVRTGWDTPVTSEWTSSQTADISDGAWHTMDLVYDLTTGAAEWYKDGVLVDTLPDNAALKQFYQGRPAAHFEFWQKYLAVDQASGLLFDDVQSFSAPLTGPPVISGAPSNPDHAWVGMEYIRQLGVSAGARPVTWSLEYAPDGAQIDPQTGRISGWYTTEADTTSPQPFLVRATNSDGDATVSWDVVVTVMDFGKQLAAWTFDNDAEGWTGEGWKAGQYSPGDGYWVSTGGNLGGFMHANGDGGTNNTDSCTREGWSMTMPFSTVGLIDVTVSYDVSTQLNTPPNPGCGGNTDCNLSLLEGPGTCEDKVLVQYSTTGTSGPWTTASGLREGTDLPTAWAKYFVQLSDPAIQDNPDFALRFIWQFNTGADNGGIDNVILWSACNLPAADVDGDGDVDQTDFAVLQQCFTGPDWSEPLSQVCHCLDWGDDNNDGLPDRDGDIDTYDVIAFEKCASGPGIAADPGCATAMSP